MSLSRIGAVTAETIRRASTEFAVYIRPTECVVVCASTGGANLQAYLTADECRELAVLLVNAADELQQIPVPEVADSDFATFSEATK